MSHTVRIGLVCLLAGLFSQSAAAAPSAQSAMAQLNAVYSDLGIIAANIKTVLAPKWDLRFDSAGKPVKDKQYKLREQIFGQLLTSQKGVDNVALQQPQPSTALVDLFKKVAKKQNSLMMKSLGTQGQQSALYVALNKGQISMPKPRPIVPMGKPAWRNHK